MHIVKCTPHLIAEIEIWMSSCEALREDLKCLWLTFLLCSGYGKQIEGKGTFTHTNSLKVRTSRRAVLEEFKGECFAPCHLLLRSCAPKVSEMMFWEPAEAQKSSKFRKSSIDKKLSKAHLIWSLRLRFDCLPLKLTWRSEMPLKHFSHFLCLRAAHLQKRAKNIHKLVEGPKFPKGRY